MMPIDITRNYTQAVLANKAIYDARINKINEFNFINYLQNLK